MLLLSHSHGNAMSVASWNWKRRTMALLKHRSRQTDNYGIMILRSNIPALPWKIAGQEMGLWMCLWWSRKWHVRHKIALTLSKVQKMMHLLAWLLSKRTPRMEKRGKEWERQSRSQRQRRSQLPKQHKGDYPKWWTKASKKLKAQLPRPKKKTKERTCTVTLSNTS